MSKLLGEASIGSAIKAATSTIENIIYETDGQQELNAAFKGENTRCASRRWEWQKHIMLLHMLCQTERSAKLVIEERIDC